MKGRLFILRGLRSISKHLARSGKIELAMRSLPLYGGKDIVCPIEVSVYGRELVFKGVGHEALSGQMVTFVRLYVGNDVKDRSVALHGGTVNFDPIE